MPSRRTDQLSPRARAERRLLDRGRLPQAALVPELVGGMELVDPTWTREPPPNYLEQGWGRRGAPPPDQDPRMALALEQARLIEGETHRLVTDADFWAAVFPALVQAASVPEEAMPEAGSLPVAGDEDTWVSFYGDHPEALTLWELATATGALGAGLEVEDAADIAAAIAFGAHATREEMVERIAGAVYEAPRGRLRLVNVDKPTALAFVRDHHSALPVANLRGALYLIGAVFGGRLVAVAVATTPSGHRGRPERGCPQDGVLELSRVASAYPGLTTTNRRGQTVPVSASSALTARVMDLLPLSGRRGVRGCLFVTYSLLGEEGITYASLASKGLRPVARTQARARLSGSRASADPDVSLGLEPKIRWEAGPAADPPDWSLLPPRMRRGAELAFGAYERRAASSGAY